MRLPCRAPAIALAVLLTPALAQAEWAPGGNRIGSGSSEFAATASGPDRVIVAWGRQVTSARYEVRAQAWTAEGAIATGWPNDGVLVSNIASQYGSLAVCDDGAGGAFIAWMNSHDQWGAYLQHVSGAGRLAPGWEARGLLFGPSIEFGPTPALAPDGAGGVFVGTFESLGPRDFRVVVDHFDEAGAPAPGWPAGGFSIPYASGVGLAVDSGRLFVSTVETDPADWYWHAITVRRLDSSAIPDASWPQPGALLADAGFAYRTRLFPDGTGGVFVSWDKCFDCSTVADRWLARVQADGSRGDGWLPGRSAYSLAPDGTGGTLLGAVIGGRPGAARLDAGGALMPGWAAHGNAAITEVVNPNGVRVTGDGHGGAFVVWMDTRTGGNSRLYASRLDALGQRAPEWPALGSFIDAGRGSLYPVGLLTLRPDVAIMVWKEWDSSSLVGYLAALRPDAPGPLPDLRPVDEAVGFGIVQAAPNPTTGPIVMTVELRNDGPARLDLIDASGRIRESRDFGFATQARGIVRFNENGALSAGVYWLRLTQAGHVATRKLAVLR